MTKQELILKHLDSDSAYGVYIKGRFIEIYKDGVRLANEEITSNE